LIQLDRSKYSYSFRRYYFFSITFLFLFVGQSVKAFDFDKCDWALAHIQEPVPPYSIGVKVWVRDANVTDSAKVKKVVDLINDVTNFFADDLSLPKGIPLTVYLHEVHDHPEADTRSISVPFQFGKGGSTKSHEETRPPIIHELAHVLAYESLKKQFPNLSDILFEDVSIEDHWEEVGKMSSEVGRMESDPKVLHESVEEMHQAIKKKVKDILDLQARHNANHLFLAPYFELLADTCTVAYLKDGSAVSRAITRPDQGDHRAHPTDFTVPHEADSAEEHEISGPTRYHIWTKYLGNKKFRGREAEVTGYLIKAVGNELTRRKKEQFEQLSPKEWNDKMIQEIDRILEPVSNHASP
jgi:hypothetical protein